MRKYICDVCRKEIKSSDIHVEMDLRVADKRDTADLHSTCYYKLLRTVKELLDELNEDESYTIKAENI